jgi:hypothetical protein
MGNKLMAKKKKTMAMYTFQSSDSIPKKIRIAKSKELT